MISRIIRNSLCILLSLYVALWPASSISQTATLLPNGMQQFFDNNGNPLTAGTVDFYIPSTTTRKNTWQDAAETIVNTNPVILDGAGRALIYGDGSYRQVLKDAGNNLIWDKIVSSFANGNTIITTGDGDLVGTIKPWAGIIAPNQYAFANGQEISRVTFPDLFTAITQMSNVACTNSSTTITGVADTTQIPIGAKIELTCVPPGTTVTSKGVSTVTLSAASNVTLNTTALFFAFGNGNGTTTFNLPDLRGYVVAGRPNMGGIASTNLTSTFFGTNPQATGATGGNQSTTLLNANLPAYTPSGSVALGFNDPGHTHATSTGVTASSGPVLQALATAVTGTSTTNSSTTGITFSPSFTGAAQGGTSTPFSTIQPTITLNYIIKITPDTSAQQASGVSSLGGQIGAISCGTGIICTGNSINILSGATLLSSNNTWTGDNYFRSGRPWCDVRAQGAVGDGITNDHTAIAACITLLQGFTPVGGIVYFPPGTYCDFTGQTTSGAGIRFVGASRDATLYSTCAHDVNLITINALQDGIENMVMVGVNSTAASAAIIFINSGCVECQVLNVRMAFGGVAIKDNGTDTVLDLVTANNTYGASIINKNGGNGFYRRVKIDQSFPTSSPTPNTTTFSAWTNAHVYASQTVVSTGGFLFQAAGACTSGGSFPAGPYIYSVSVIDNTCTWNLAFPVVMDSLLINGTAAQMEIQHADVTFGGRAGINITTTGNAFVISDSTFALGSFNVWAQNGSGLILRGNTMGGCAAGTQGSCGGVFLDVGWTGDSVVSNNSIVSTQFGVLINSPNAVIANNMIYGATTAGISIAANRNSFTIEGNQCGTSTNGGPNLVGILVAAGTSDHYRIIGNNCFGASTQYTDGGTGTDKIVDGTGWTAYTPTLTCSTGAPTSSTTVGSRYKQLGAKTIAIHLFANITVLNTCATNFFLSLPINASTSSQFNPGFDQNTATFVAVQINAGGVIAVFSTTPAAHQYSADFVYEQN